MKKEAKTAVNQITEGVIWKQLLLFFFPIVFGTFFQQIYNTADTIVVGRFVGKQALAAVGGSTTVIVNLAVGLFVGLSSGASVILAQFYGAKDDDSLEKTLHTAFAFSIIGSIVLGVIGYAGSRWMLQIMDTPADVLEDSVLYLHIYFIGMLFNLLYNMGAGILRAVGDSKRPLYFLAASCMVNIALDIVLVVFFRLGVVGAAIATILSQLFSAFLVVVCLIRTKDMHRLVLRKLRLDGRMLKRIIRIGLPAGMQSVMYGLSNVIIQSGINSLGTNTVAAWAAYSKLDSMFWMMINAFGISITTFVGQNYGAGKMDRVHRGVRTCMVMTVLASLGMSFFIYRYGVYGYELFTTDRDVISIGIAMMRYLAPLYVEYVAIEILSGSLRGVGDCWCPMIISLLGVCVLRVGWILIAVPLKRDIYTIMFSYPLTWVTTTVLFVIYYLFFGKLKRERAGIRKAAGA